MAPPKIDSKPKHVAKPEPTADDVRRALDSLFEIETPDQVMDTYIKEPSYSYMDLDFGPRRKTETKTPPTTFAELGKYIDFEAKKGELGVGGGTLLTKRERTNAFMWGGAEATPKKVWDPKKKRMVEVEGKYNYTFLSRKHQTKPLLARSSKKPERASSPSTRLGGSGKKGSGKFINRPGQPGKMVPEGAKGTAPNLDRTPKFQGPPTEHTKVELSTSQAAQLKAEQGKYSEWANHEAFKLREAAGDPICWFGYDSKIRW